MLFPYHDENPTERTPWLTILLIALNVWVHIQLVRLPEDVRELRYYEYGFVPLRLVQVFEGKPVAVDARFVPDLLKEESKQPTVRRTGRSWWERRSTREVVILEPDPPLKVFRSMITSMFLHGSWLHLIGNMWFFWIFGNNVEDRLGAARFLLFYLLGGLIAVIFHYAAAPTSPIPVIGASGAVSAVLGGYLTTWPNARIRCLAYVVLFLTTISLPAWFFISLWFLAQITGVLSAAGAEAGGIAWWAHIGGFLAGIFLMLLMGGRSQPARDLEWSKADF